MRRWVGYSALGVAAYLVFLMALLPAERLLGWIETGHMGIELHGVHGTLRTGGAQAVHARGLRFDDLHWQFEPMGLVRGRAQLALEFRGAEGPGRASIGVRPDGALHLERGELVLGLHELVELAPALLVRPDGTLRLQVDELVMQEGIRHADATLRWIDAALHLDGRVALGDLIADIREHEGGLLADIRDAGGPLVANGSLRLSADGSYELTAKLGTRGDSPQLAQALSLLGGAQADGGIPVRFTGRLRANPAM